MGSTSTVQLLWRVMSMAGRLWACQVIGSPVQQSLKHRQNARAVSLLQLLFRRVAGVYTLLYTAGPTLLTCSIHTTIFAPLREALQATDAWIPDCPYPPTLLT